MPVRILALWKPKSGGKKERRKMNDMEFRNFLQKQQDLEDEHETARFTICLGRLKDLLASHGSTLEEWKAKLVAEGKVEDLATLEKWERKSSK